MRSPSSPRAATRRPQLRPTAIPRTRGQGHVDGPRACLARTPLPTPSAHKADSRVDGPRTSRARRCPPPVRRCPPPSREAGASHFFAVLNRDVCAAYSRNASGLLKVSRETFVPISHYIATIVSRETISASAMAANGREVPSERRRLRRTQLRSERGLFSRSIFQTATTARPCGKAVAAFPLVVKATVEAGQVGWKACAAKRSVLVELR